MSRKPYSSVIFIFWISYALSSSKPLKDAPLSVGGKAKSTSLAGGKEIFHKRVTMSEAMSYCESNRSTPGRLVVLPSLEDAEKLVNELFEKSEKISEAITEDEQARNKKIGDAERRFDLGLSRRYWIGLTDVIKEGSWIWLKDGRELGYSEMWTGGQPDHVGEKTTSQNEHCVTLWNPNFEDLDGNKKISGKHSFNDENCNMKNYFICENIPADAARQGRSLSASIRQVQVSTDEQPGELHDFNKLTKMMQNMQGWDGMEASKGNTNGNAPSASDKGGGSPSKSSANKDKAPASDVLEDLLLKTDSKERSLENIHPTHQLWEKMEDDETWRNTREAQTTTEPETTPLIRQPYRRYASNSAYYSPITEDEEINSRPSTSNAEFDESKELEELMKNRNMAKAMDDKVDDNKEAEENLPMEFHEAEV